MIQNNTLQLTGITETSISKDRFKINHYTFVKDHPFDDLVTTSAPYYHFQILKPVDEEQKQKAIDYFQEHNKLFVAWVNFPHILLYVGATEDIYIRSSLCKEVDADEIVKVMEQASHWYRFYGVE